MYDDLATIRRIIDGLTINTDTAHRFHIDAKVVSELVDGNVVHRRMCQGLYQVLPDGPYFLAFWNKPYWDEATLRFTFSDDLCVIDAEQAKQWMRTYCPAQFDKFVNDMGKPDKAPSVVAINLRIPVELRAHLTTSAELTNNSFNKICLNLIYAGMSVTTRPRPGTPASYVTLRLPSGEPAVDQFERAMTFEDGRDQELANCAEQLYWLARNDEPKFLGFVLWTLYRLFHVERDDKRATCFALWLTHFHRAGPEVGEEFRRRRPGPMEYGEWQWVKTGEERDLASRFSYKARD
ncbi:hypothetical protein [Paraburkholderia tropica]|uniref:hypothetical protein n=1 Tax=Paraburkholderia tropica TaxID=92647 RepID=UPI002AAF3F82|nr:hypothetical protein [Paraburkholderia tropica]